VCPEQVQRRTHDEPGMGPEGERRFRRTDPCPLHGSDPVLAQGVRGGLTPWPSVPTTFDGRRSQISWGTSIDQVRELRAFSPNSTGLARPLSLTALPDDRPLLCARGRTSQALERLRPFTFKTPVRPRPSARLRSLRKPSSKARATNCLMSRSLSRQNCRI